MRKIIIVALLIASQISSSQKLFSSIAEYTIEPSASYNASAFADNKSFAPEEKKELIKIFSQPAYFVMEFTANESLYKCKDYVMHSESDKSPKLNFLQTFGGGASRIYYSNSKEKLTVAQQLTFGELFW